METEKKIKELEDQVEILQFKVKKLEGIETRRQIKKNINFVLKLIFLFVIIFVGWQIYNRINEKYIKPYKETIDKIDEFYDKTKDNKLLDKIFNNE